MLDKNFWDNRYKTGQTGWDIGAPSTPLTDYIDSLVNKDLAILIPGCGRAYEAEYFFKKGFKDITVIDISPTALHDFSKRLPDFPKKQLINANFFDLQGKYDLLIEQTFFCAIDVSLRQDYVKHASSILKKEGKIVGLLFAEEFGNDYPPFGGTKKEYIKLFSENFEIQKIELAHNSIEKRKGRELFISFKNKIT